MKRTREDDEDQHHDKRLKTDNEDKISAGASSIRKSPSPRQLKRCQDALAAVRAGKNVFVTGEGGTGKSYWIDSCLELLSETHPVEAVALCAPTGLAATNIGGQTIHSKFSIFPSAVPEDAELVKLHTVKVFKRQRETWNRTKVLIIDEISMVSPSLFLYLDAQAKISRRQFKEPFGGIQLIFCGDFAQLPPVWTRRSEPTTRFVFELPLWREIVHNPRTCFVLMLDEVLRQSDPAEIALLSRVRLGQHTPQDVEHLQSLKEMKNAPPDGIEPTRLFPHKNTVDNLNETKLAELPGEEVEYVSIAHFATRGRSKVDHEEQQKAIRTVLKDHPVLERTKLKIGAQVMLMKNVNVAEGLANGSRGVVVGFTDPTADVAHKDGGGDEVKQEGQKQLEKLLKLSEFQDYDGESMLRKMTSFFRLKPQQSRERLPIVKFANQSNPIVITDCAWEHQVLDDKGVVVIRTKPLRLAWAVTIHKSQGMTIDYLTVDLKGCFEAGMFYTAISRCVGLNNLCVESLDPRDIRVCPKVLAFHDELKNNLLL